MPKLKILGRTNPPKNKVTKKIIVVDSKNPKAKVIDLVDKTSVAFLAPGVKEIEINTEIRHIAGLGWIAGIYQIDKRQLRRFGYPLRNGILISVVAKPVKPGSHEMVIVSKLIGNSRKSGDMRNNSIWRSETPLVIDQIEWFYQERDRITRETGIPHHVDHIHPVNHRLLCGLTVPANLRVIPATENLRKGNTLI